MNSLPSVQKVGYSSNNKIVVLPFLHLCWLICIFYIDCYLIAKPRNIQGRWAIGALRATVSKRTRVSFFSSSLLWPPYLLLSLRVGTMRQPLGFSREEICASRRVCFAALLGKQHISHSFPKPNFLIGLKQLKSQRCTTSLWTKDYFYWLVENKKPYLG